LIKLFDPHVTNDEVKSVSHVIESKFWASGNGGGNVEKFENKFQKYVNCKSCISVNSGTAALHLAILSLNPKSKKIIVPSLTFVSTVNSILYAGAIPVFVDVDPKTMCLDIDDLKKKITKEVEIIIPVHFAGMPTNLRQISDITKTYNISMIEDAAHAAGATYNGKKIGSHSDAVCFSFHPVKNLAMPNGGAICINGNKIRTKIKTLKSLRWCGIDNRNGFDYDVPRLGWNYYMNEISACVGLVQLKKLDKLNKIRQKIAKKYFSEINIEEKMPFDNSCSYHFYWIRVKNRSKFMKKLESKGIQTGIHYHPVHLMSLYKNNIKLPITEKICKEIVSIPTHPNLSNEDVDKIILSINEII
jgi:perosamine synthetase